MTAVGRADPSVALVTAQYLMTHAALARPDNPWPAHVRGRVQKSAIEGPALVNALRVEPDLGTPARGGLPATVAAREDGGYRLTGRKTYCTGIPGLRWMLVWARTDDPEPLVGSFLVEAAWRWLPGGADLGPPGHACHSQRRCDFRGGVDPRGSRGGGRPGGDAADRPRRDLHGLEQRADRGGVPRRGAGRQGLADRVPGRAHTREPGLGRWPRSPVSRPPSGRSRRGCW